MKCGREQSKSERNNRDLILSLSPRIGLRILLFDVEVIKLKFKYLYTNKRPVLPFEQRAAPLSFVRVDQREADEARDQVE